VSGAGQHRGIIAGRFARGRENTHRKMATLKGLIGIRDGLDMAQARKQAGRRASNRLERVYTQSWRSSLDFFCVIIDGRLFVGVYSLYARETEWYCWRFVRTLPTYMIGAYDRLSNRDCCEVIALAGCKKCLGDHIETIRLLARLKGTVLYTPWMSGLRFSCVYIRVWMMPFSSSQHSELVEVL
jgi:hypothetical protein